MMRWIGISTAVLLLAACGGSGGGSPPAAVCPYDASLRVDDPGCTNAQPLADAGLSSTADAGEIVVLDARGSRDPDGTIVSYVWSQADGPAVALGTATSAIASFIAPRLATATDLVFQIRVTDDDGIIATDRVTVRVNSTTNLPPIADAGIDQVASAGATVVLDGRASTDPDTPLANFLWEQIDSTATVQLRATTQPQAVFDAPTIPMSTVLHFRLTVTDDFGEQSSDEVAVTILASTFHNLSGTISAPSGVIGDTDTNDPLAPYAPNDDADQAQAIPNPVTVGGYANMAGSGSSGRSTVIGDPDDYFAVSLTSGTQINLTIAEPAAGDLDLYLLDESRNMVDSSAGVGQTESVSASVAGDYFINVTAFDGASNYTLVVGQTLLSTGPRAARLTDAFVPGEAIVRMKPAVERKNRQAPATRLAASGFTVRATGPDRMSLLDLDAVFATRIMASARKERTDSLRFRNATDRRKWQTLMALKTLAADPDVEFAEPNYLYQPLATPNDPFYSFQWHYPLINLPAAWDLETGSSNVTVAVIDSGILTGHPDFLGRLVNGFDFVSELVNAGDGDGIDPNPADPGTSGQSSVFHGTHVAGTIGAASNNGTGVAGVAWNVRLMPLRVCGTLGCSVFDQIEAMRYAAGLSNSSGSVASPRADIINMSLGGPGFSFAAQTAINAVRGAGVIIIAAAGNDASNELLYPASYNGVVSVSAVGPNQAITSYSSFGTAIDVAAPGGNLATDLNGDGYGDGVLSPHADDSSGQLDYEYLFLEGTSMAAPHVAGVAALMKSANANLTPALFDQLLSRGDLTDELGTPGRDNLYGYGLIDAQKAVAAALTAGGAAPADNPLLSSTPQSLNFGSTTNSIEIQLENSGTGTLAVVSVSSSESWAQVLPLDIDANELGTYVVAVDRNGLDDGVYTAEISVTSNVNSLLIPLIMSVGDAVGGGNVGHLYIALLDPETNSTVFGAQADFMGGGYLWQMVNAPAGNYLVVAGTDTDNDGFICDDGEACGEYITRDQPIIIALDADLTGLDFPVNYTSQVGTLTLTTVTPAEGSDDTVRPIRRTPETSPVKQVE
ncbi:MAG: S8 family serine peptidase [Gammaproteobacteria bacterium]